MSCQEPRDIPRGPNKPFYRVVSSTGRSPLVNDHPVRPRSQRIRWGCRNGGNDPQRDKDDEQKLLHYDHLLIVNYNPIEAPRKDT